MAGQSHAREGDAFNPLDWAHVALAAKSIDDARSQLMNRLSREIHVNSFLLTVGGRLPSGYLPGQGLRMAPLTAKHISGELVSKDWMTFLWKDGNARNDPMVRRLRRTTRPMFGWEESDLHRSMVGAEKRFARHYFEHCIRLGILDGNVDFEAGRIDTFALDSHMSFQEFKQFENNFGARLKLAFAWFSEATRVRALATDAPTITLTGRERECLQWAAAGLNTSEISDCLKISDATVNEHIASAMRRLGAGTRVQACARATLLGLAVP